MKKGFRTKMQMKKLVLMLKLKKLVMKNEDGEGQKECRRCEN